MIRESIKRSHFLDYLDRPSSLGMGKKNNGVPKVAVLYVEGTITDGWSDDGFR